MTASLRDGWLVLISVLVALAAPGCGCERRGAPPADGTPRPLREAPVAPRVVPKAAEPAPPAPPAAGPTPTPLTACAADGDCVAVAGDCCGCNAGGSQAVVARAKQAEFEAARSARCREAMCIALMSSHPSCRQQPRCVGGSCRLVNAGDGGAPPAAAPAAPQ